MPFLVQEIFQVFDETG